MRFGPGRTGGAALITAVAIGVPCVAWFVAGSRGAAREAEGGLRFVVALDARTGEEVWKTAVNDWELGYYMTMAPLIAEGMVMVGTSGGEYGIRGHITGIDAESGEIQWVTHTIPGPGEPGHAGNRQKRPLSDMSRLYNAATTAQQAGQRTASPPIGENGVGSGAPIPAKTFFNPASAPGLIGRTVGGFLTAGLLR